MEAVGSEFDPSRQYTQKEVCEVIGKMLGKNRPISSKCFRNSWRTKKGFPKPIIENGTYKVWSGFALHNWFHKKGNI